MINREFWKNKKVFITGNTGFKGSWLSLWLHEMGALVTGYSLNPPTEPSLYELCQIASITKTYINDVRDKKTLCNIICEVDPDIVFHLAAQPLVRDSYQNPIETYEINVMGTLNVFEAIRHAVIKNPKKKRIIINVTTDKCYENKEWNWGYREYEAMGGYDPYSNSKACSELVTASYRNSFFNINKIEEHQVCLASARAGNVIGGGDWAKDRLIPDCMKSILNNETILIRNPSSIRPWQHVLEPLSGYLLLAQTLYTKGTAFAEGWNFGPEDQDAKSVEWIVHKLCDLWKHTAKYNVIANHNDVHEAKFLKLDCSKAKNELNWYPRWDISQALNKIVEWVKVYEQKGNISDICIKQINEYSMLIQR